MAFSKANTFNKVDFDFSLLGKGIAHPARIHILRYLFEHGRSTPKEISEDIPLSQPSIAAHFKILRELSFIEYQEDLLTIYYNINKDISDKQKKILLLLCSVSSVGKEQS